MYSAPRYEPFGSATPCPTQVTTSFGNLVAPADAPHISSVPPSSTCVGPIAEPNASLCAATRTAPLLMRTMPFHPESSVVFVISAVPE